MTPRDLAIELALFAFGLAGVASAVAAAAYVTGGL